VVKNNAAPLQEINPLELLLSNSHSKSYITLSGLAIWNHGRREVDYLYKYDKMKRYLDDRFEMSDKTVALLVRFLEQNNGKLSKRAKEGEFKALSKDEVAEIENNYHEIFIKG
jgi:hypothetical protein